LNAVNKFALVENNSEEKVFFPDLYQRKKYNILNDSLRSKSFCYQNGNNENSSLFDLNNSLINENGKNNETEKNNNLFNKKDFIEIKNLKDNIQVNYENNNMLTFESSKNKYDEKKNNQETVKNINYIEMAYKNKEKVKNKNISLPDFKNLNNSNKNDLNKLIEIDIDLKNNSFTDNNIENGINLSQINENNFESHRISKIYNNHVLDFSENLKKKEDNLDIIKDNFLSLSSYDNSLNNSLINTSYKSIKNKTRIEDEKNKIRKNNSLFENRNNFNSQNEDIKNNSFCDVKNKTSRRSQNFSYSTMLVIKKNIKKKMLNDFNNYDSEHENLDIENHSNKEFQNLEINKDKEKINNNQNLNDHNNTNQEEQINSLNLMDKIFISNPLKYKKNEINLSMENINYDSSKKNDKNSDLSQDVYKNNFMNFNIVKNSVNQKNSKNNKINFNSYDKNKINNDYQSNSVIVQNRSTRNFKQFNLLKMKEKSKIEKQFAEDHFLINSEQDVNTEPTNNKNERFYLEKLSFEINLENLERLKLETSKNNKISNRFIKNTLFKNEEEIINLNSEENSKIDKNEKPLELNITDPKENLNFSFNNSKNTINDIINPDIINNNQIFQNVEKDKKFVKKNLLIKNEKYDPNKSNLKKRKSLEIINTEKKTENYSLDYNKNNFSNNKIGDKIKINNGVINKKSINNNTNITIQECGDYNDYKSSYIKNTTIKSKENSQNIKFLKNKHLKKNLLFKIKNESKVDLENAISANPSVKNNLNNFNLKNKSKISYVKTSKNNEESLIQNRLNLKDKINKNQHDYFIHKKQDLINIDKFKIFLDTTDPLISKTNSALIKTINLSKSNCDFNNNEIFFNINKEGVFSLKPDEIINLSENEYLTNKNSTKNEVCKDEDNNFISTENEKTSINNINNSLKFQALNIYNDDIDADSNLEKINDLNNKYTLSSKNFLLSNDFQESYLNNLSNENKKISARCNSLVDFKSKVSDKKSIMQNANLSEIKNIDINKFYKECVTQDNTNKHKKNILIKLKDKECNLGKSKKTEKKYTVTSKLQKSQSNFFSFIKF